jgi:transcription elongation GreA/GreB family factor
LHYICITFILNSLSIKQFLYNHCLAFVQSRIQNIEQAIGNATESANGETKSSAGDKHETSRAMAHLEQEKNGTQMQEALKLKNILQQIDPTGTGQKINLGSLVRTDKANYYVSIGAGKAEWRGTAYFAISQLAPIAKKMLGKSRGDTFEFNKIDYLILEVL